MICGSTHALIPDFSLPGTSIGSPEADRYMKLRLSGSSQKEVSEIFTNRGLDEKYGISLEKKFTYASRKSQVLFPCENDLLHYPLLLFQSETADSTNIITAINCLFLKRGFNPLYFSRNNILRIRELKTGKSFPLNQEGVCPNCEILDSG